MDHSPAQRILLCRSCTQLKVKINEGLKPFSLCILHDDFFFCFYPRGKGDISHKSKKNKREEEGHCEGT